MAKVTERLSAKEIATQWDANPRTVRKFFRAEGLNVERGNRYAFTPSEVKKMTARFNKWVAQAEAEKAAELPIDGK
jgi:hypothetical protein